MCPGWGPQFTLREPVLGGLPSGSLVAPARLRGAARPRPGPKHAAVDEEVHGGRADQPGRDVLAGLFLAGFQAVGVGAHREHDDDAGGESGDRHAWVLAQHLGDELDGCRGEDDAGGEVLQGAGEAFTWPGDSGGDACHGSGRDRNGHIADVDRIQHQPSPRWS